MVFCLTELIKHYDETHALRPKMLYLYIHVEKLKRTHKVTLVTSILSINKPTLSVQLQRETERRRKDKRLDLSLCLFFPDLKTCGRSQGLDDIGVSSLLRRSSDLSVLCD